MNEQELQRLVEHISDYCFPETVPPPRHLQPPPQDDRRALPPQQPQPGFQSVGAGTARTGRAGKGREARTLPLPSAS